LFISNAPYSKRQLELEFTLSEIFPAVDCKFIHFLLQLCQEAKLLARANYYRHIFDYFID